MIDMIEKVLPFTIDLDQPIMTTVLPTLFATDENEAHRFELTLHRSGVSVDLTNVSAEASFVQCSNRATADMDGTIEDGKIVVTLKEACYAYAGKFTLTITLKKDGKSVAIFHGVGGVTRSRTNSVIVDEHVIRTIEDIEAQIDSKVKEAIGVAGGSGESGGTGENGADGYSPTVTLTQLAGGVQIDVQNKDGTQTATVSNGKDGADGSDGEDGTGSSTVTTGETIPDYWQTHLDERVPEIRAAMAAAGFNKSAFLWYHDIHWTYGYKQAPMLLKYLHAHTPINKTMFGGDVIDEEGDDTTTMSYLWDWRDAIRDIPNHHSVPGNHDDGNTIDNRFDDPYIYAFLQAAEETPDVVRGDSGLYYYIDAPAEKTRYLYLDTATKDGNILNDTAQQEWLKAALLQTPDSWHIVAIAHIWRTYDSSYVDNGWGYGAKIALDMFDAYNARTGDYASCTGKVEFCIGGHTHIDADHYSDGGILVMLTECDSRNVRSGLDCTEGTITEASVNAIIADYANEKVSVIRIGRGSSRVVALTEGGDTGGDSGGDDGSGEEGGEDSGGTDTPTIPEGDFTNVLTAVGYTENVRYSSSSEAETAATGWDLTGYIPATRLDVIRFANVNFFDLDGTGGTSRAQVYSFDADKGFIGGSEGYSAASPMSDAWSPVYGEDGDLIQFTVPSSYSSTVAYIRIGARNIDQYSVITVNEAIE